ncbi:SAVMC3_10250 family protein (plasmid) [Sinorhizobium meliloti]|nr:hypothetical protein LZK74_03790 [Sinorhizobium meliloti]WKL28509.1 SAVMC3_10250 family protein [Sinorhizobium meliloti]WKL34038.1 SAVMC3_10250 family protein [Sinorhizobium meliloti]
MMTKYYLYVSTSKLDMLADQIPESAKQKYAAEFGFNWGVASGKIGAEIEPPQPSKRLDAVAHYLIAEKKPRCLEDAREWVLDRLTVKHLAVRAVPNLFLLVGKRNGMLHCLGGSTHHVVGNRRGKEADSSYSYFPYMAEALSREFSEEGISFPENREKLYGKDKVSRELAGVRSHEWADAVADLYSNPAPTFEIAFLSRFLAQGRDLNGEYCTVSSPLYVELK